MRRHITNIDLDPLASPVVVTVTEPTPLATLASDHLASIAFRRRARLATEA